MIDFQAQRLELKDQYRALVSTIGLLKGQYVKVEVRLAELLRNVENSKQDRSLRLGIFGVRGSAKSSLLAAWYLFNVDPDRKILLKFKDDDSVAYLKNVATPILETGRSHATPSATPKTIRFDLIIRGEVWHVETMDFAGHFLELVSDPMERKLAQPARDFLKHCDVILCCHYWKDRDQETLDAINRILEQFHQQFLLALTRVDEIGTLPHSREEFEAIVNRLRQENKWFSNLMAHVTQQSQTTGTVYAIAVSPLGKDFSDSDDLRRGRQKLSLEDFEPFGIYRPLELAVERRKKAEGRLSAEQHSLERELEVVADQLRQARSKEAEMQKQFLALVRGQLAIMRQEVESLAADTEDPEVIGWRRYSLEARNIQAETAFGEDSGIHADADGFLVWLDQQRNRLDRERKIKELDMEFQALEAEIEPYLDAATVHWEALATETWLISLDRIGEEARSLGRLRLWKECGRYRSILERKKGDAKHRRREFLEWAVVILLGMLLASPLLYFLWLLKH